MDKAWDLKYRPTTYEEMTGNPDIARQLSTEHPVRSYILHGKSGQGKTTAVRIFANQLNAEVLEYDAASLGKDDIENIKKAAQHTSMFNPYKLIILDEAHTLSNQAKDALLKAIEEGNKATIWALCTTELHKMNPALQTRSRIIEIKPTGKEEMRNHLNKILDNEDTGVGAMILDEIIFFADGSVRQAVKLLETMVTTGTMDLPFTQREAIEVLTAVYNNDILKIQEAVSQYTNNDIYVLIKLISEFMTAFSLFQARDDKEQTMGEVLSLYTTLSPVLVDNLRDLTSAITSTVDTPAHKGVSKVLNRLYTLLDTLMDNYNNFEDNRYNIKASLVWYASQLDIWIEEGK